MTNFIGARCFSLLPFYPSETPWETFPSPRERNTVSVPRMISLCPLMVCVFAIQAVLRFFKRVIRMAVSLLVSTLILFCEECTVNRNRKLSYMLRQIMIIDVLCFIWGSALSFGQFYFRKMKCARYSVSAMGISNFIMFQILRNFGAYGGP